MTRSNFDTPFRDSGFQNDDRTADTTGRYIVVFKRHKYENHKKVCSILNKIAGIRERDVISATDFSDSAIDPESAGNAEGIFLPNLGIAIVAAEPSQIQAYMSNISDKESDISLIEPERMLYPLSHHFSREYIHGYRDGVNHLCDQLLKKYSEEELLESVIDVYRDTQEFTWGLQATRTHTSPYSGQGVKVAILDTGFDLKHPDFKGRKIVDKSFVLGQSSQDTNGHGTHCTGTACGSKQPSKNIRRYGCAYEAEIYIGKVLGNAGGYDRDILSGMEWAIASGCQVISMSLGSNSDVVNPAYEKAALRALDKDCLIIAAAGNNANRRWKDYGFVGVPANSLSIMAVGAVDNQLRIADFSARSSDKTGIGGKVDIVGPGVDVYSSYIGGYKSLDGTSMATPHVAGIAALWIEATKKTGRELWATLLQNSRQIPGDARDIGSGLVQAPQ